MDATTFKALTSAKLDALRAKPGSELSAPDFVAYLLRIGVPASDIEIHGSAVCVKLDNPTALTEDKPLN